MAQFPNTTAADGIWTLKKVRRAILGDNWPALVVPDEFFANTVLLLQADDFADGSQNNTFLDSSTNTHTITRNGSVTQGSFSPFSQDEGKWGNYFGTAGNYLDTPSSSTFSFDADFTVECWVYQTERGNNGVVAEIENYQNGVMIRLGTEGGIYDAIYVNNTLIVRPVQYIDLNTWAHIAVVRSGTTVTVYIDGVSIATATVSGTVNSTSGETRLGAPLHTTATAQPFFGYITNFRIVKGTAVYTSAFTPSTTPLTAISGTSLLTCQSNRFVDNSSNAHSITVNGNTEVTPFSPFAPSTPYDSATKGGSGYFDGNGDYLRADTALDAITSTSSPFTVEGWVYPLVLGDQSNNDDCVIGMNRASDGNNVLTISNTQLRYNGSEIGHSDLKINEWNHFAFVYSGSGFTFFINGTSDVTNGTSISTAPSDLVFGIGVEFDAGNGGSPGNYYNGYISDIRVTASQVYTSAFTPPTAPLTAVSGTSILCNFTNAGIYDGTGRNVLETVGNAQVDTTTVKYGTGAMEFDEAGDYLTLLPTENVSFGTGDFTIELWAYFATSPTDGEGLFQLSNGYLNTQVRGPAAGATSGSGLWAIYYGTTQANGTSAPSTNTWYHVAYVRNSGTTKLYIDGTEEISVSDSTNYTDTYFTIGGWYTGAYLFNGYIDDFRITKGVARYTANFTPPTAKLEQQ